MLSIVSSSEKKRNKICIICNDKLTDFASSPDICKHLFHYKCIRNYVDNRLEKKQPISCPEKSCKKFFSRIANKFKNSDDIVYQNVIMSNDETQCCICFAKYKIPVASSDSCSHTFCFDCLKKWCTFKHECPMDRVPIKMLLISDFPGGHIISKMEPPPVEQDLNGDGDNDELMNTTCEFCHSGQDEHQLLLCDTCNRGYHIYCLPVPLNAIPDGDWFCQTCRSDALNHNDEEARVVGPPIFRGLGRIITDWQERLTGNVTTQNPQRRRNNPANNNRRARTNARPVRSTRRNEFVGESDDDWSEEIVSEDDRYPNLRQASSVGLESDYVDNRNRINAVESRTEGLRTRQGRRAIIEEEEEEEVEEAEVTMGTRSRRQGQLSVSNYASDNTTSSRNIRAIIGESEEETPVRNNRRNIRTRSGNASNISNALRRRKQGSLSSDIESEVEPSRKKHRVDNGSSSNESKTVTEDENDEKSTSDDTSTDEDIRHVTSTITTRLRARDNQSSDYIREESPLPRPVKNKRKIDDDSDEEPIDDDNENFGANCVNQKKRLIIESDSSDDVSEQSRERHVSSSSSLSTIPCRTSDMTDDRPVVPHIKSTIKHTKQSHIEPQDVFSNSSTGESTDSDYNPALDNVNWAPFTSTRRKTKNPKPKQLPTLTVETRRRSSRLSSNSLKINDSLAPDVENIDGQCDTHLAQNNDEHSTVNRSFNSSGSILSEINEKQMSPSLISVTPSTSSSTERHTPKKDRIILSIKHNVHRGHTITTHNTASSASTHDRTPSTSAPSTQTNTQASSSSSSLLSHPIRVAATHASQSANHNHHHHPKTKIVNYVKAALNGYYDDDVIDHDELKTLNKRIVEKIIQRNGDMPEMTKVNEYVLKYMTFYVDKRDKNYGERTGK